ncbi:hypothetical protein EDB83DRAFT_2568581 [Lactarius deliciosus]|nr:hypothetical protein EDB83DRAFT_2568581 [Lactarius deliciosus]
MTQRLRIDRKIEEHPRLPHRAGYPHRFCARHDVLGSAHGAHQCTTPYTAAPVDVWGLGVVLHILACHAAPFDEPTVAAMHESSRRSLDFLLEADPAARASLHGVLAYWWMNPTPGPRSLLGAYMAANATTTHAALRWPEKVDHDLLRAPADDAWRKQNLLELVARLCEAPNARRPT